MGLFSLVRTDSAHNVDEVVLESFDEHLSVNSSGFEQLLRLDLSHLVDFHYRWLRLGHGRSLLLSLCLLLEGLGEISIEVTPIWGGMASDAFDRARQPMVVLIKGHHVLPLNWRC